MSVEKGRRLGRGLEALIAKAPVRTDNSLPQQPDRAPARAAAPLPESPLRNIPISQIRPNPLQPRKEFKAEDLADLEASLRVSGLLQPVTVRTATTGTGFELIAGERRFRAAQRLGWAEIPAIVKEVDDRLLLSLAMVENLQRADLNPIEEAEGYEQLIKEFSLTQQEVADIVGKDRSTVANTLRLLLLPASVRRLVWDGQLTIGHARALLGMGDESRIADLAREVVAQGLSVREVERRVREAAQAQGKKPTAGGTGSTGDVRSAEVRRLEDRLRKHLGTDLKILQSGKERGELRVPFYSADDFERLVALILGEDLSE
ncbi:MAG: ParB/RepB/Spo0J family partition protein [Gemmatimonadaceae bacterium]|nr:ParB/RepB/Spo0J family partition protein [Gemmatimonadaceae bacterium]